MAGQSVKIAEPSSVLTDYVLRVNLSFPVPVPYPNPGSMSEPGSFLLRTRFKPLSGLDPYRHMVQARGMSETGIAPAILPVPVPVKADNPVPRGFKTRIDPFKAREFGIKSGIARRERAERARQAKLNPQPVTAPVPVQAQPDPFVREQLDKTRYQLDKLYRMLDDSRNPLEIDKIASSIAKLSVIEQNLAGRPGPGTLRPAEQVKSQSRASWLLGGETSEIINKTPVKIDVSPVDTRSEQE